MSYIDDDYGIMFNDMLDVEIIWQVAKHQSFAAAGRVLAQPPATVSRRVSAMEKKAAVRLFERTTRSVQITEQGKLVATHARRILDEHEAVQASIEALRSEPTGKLRISAPIILGEALLGAVVQQFLQRYPDCQAFVDISNRKVDLVEEQYDVAIRVGSSGSLDLIARRLGVVEAGLYQAVRKDNPQSTTELTKPSDLAQQQVMLLQGNDHVIDELVLYDKDNNREAVAVQTRLITNNPQLLMQAGEATQAFMVLPHMLTSKKVRTGLLKPVLTDWAVHRFEVYAIMTSRKQMRPAVRAFLDIMVLMLKQKLMQNVY